MLAVKNAARFYSQRLMIKSREAVKTAFSNKYLLYTNISIAVSLSSLGDAIEQGVEVYRKDIDEFDKTRNINMSISGLPMGIICHSWYKFLDRRIPGGTIQIALKKVVLDQFVCSPLCISSLFITLGLLEGSNFEKVKEEIYDKAWRLYAAEWVIWPPAQFINFYILPLRFRVLFDSIVSLGYDIYTSYVTHQKPEKEEILIAVESDVIQNIPLVN